MATKSLSQVVAEKPYPDFAEWWTMGNEFLAFMQKAICSEWQAIAGGTADLAPIQADVALYTQLVYGRVARTNLAADFLAQENASTFQSGEFDALSYAFYKSAFDTLAVQLLDGPLIQEARHAFTQRVGALFYAQLHEHLELRLPHQLETALDLLQLQQAIGRIGDFLHIQGYLRDHFAFHFDVNLQHGGRYIAQQTQDVIPRVAQQKPIYALYEMGYPVILPSAVYLYQTLGEAQHHSSRTIEELFDRIGFVASETQDFDPSGYPSDLVVELWEIYHK